MKPVHWLSEFKKTLDSTICRATGQEVFLDKAFEAVVAQLREIREHDATLWWIGNGGSAALCSHLSQDAMNKLGIRSIVLNDASLLTCMANDFGYESVYSRPLNILTRPGDLLIAISSSGSSENILKSASLATEKKLKLITLSGFEPDNPLWMMPADVAFYLPSRIYGHVEVGHEALLHAVIETMWFAEKDTKETEIL